MAHAALFTLPLKDHLNPSAALVSELVERGESVTYYAIEPFRRAIEQAGATFRSHSDFGFGERPPTRNEFEVATWLLAVTPRIVETLLELVKQDCPDYIIHDSFCPWGRAVAHLLGLPAVASVHGLALNDTFFRSYASPDVDTFIKGLRSAPHLLKLWWQKTRLERRYGLPPQTTLEWLSNPQALNIVYTSQALQPVGESFDARYRFVGPVIAPRPALPFPLERLEPSGKPVIYVALGTLYTDNLVLYRACLAAFRDYRLVMAVGQELDIADLGDLPETVIVRPRVPQLEVLKRADVFVSHGGMKSVNESLYYGVPLVVVPQGVDQPVLARRVEELGVGLALEPRRADPRRLREKVAQVLSDPSYRQRSATISATLVEAGGYRQAAQEVLEHVRGLGV